MKNAIFLVIMLMLVACKRDNITAADIRDQIVSEDYSGEMVSYDTGLQPQVTQSDLKLKLRKSVDRVGRIDVIDPNTNTVLVYIEQIEQTDTVITFDVPYQTRRPVEGGYTMVGSKKFVYSKDKFSDGAYFRNKRFFTMFRWYQRSGEWNGYLKLDLMKN